MILMLIFSARLTLLNPKNESKRKSDNIVSCGALLSINYDRIAKFNLVILPFKFINCVKYIHCFLHSIYLEGNFSVIRGKHWKKKRKEYFYKTFWKKLSKKQGTKHWKKEKGTFYKNRKETFYKKIGRKNWKKREENFL